MHNVFYSYIPYIALVSTNTALLAFLTFREKTGIRKAAIPATKKSNANKMVVAITLLFIVMTFPATIVNIFYTEWIAEEWGLVVILICDAIAFTYHALSFPVLLATNLRFRGEFVKLVSSIGFIRKKETQSVSQTPNLITDQNQIEI